PVGRIDCADDAVADVVVVGGRIGDFVRHAGDGMQKIGAGDDPDELPTADYRKPLDAVLFHQAHQFLKLGLFVDGDRILRHHVLDLSAAFANKVRRGAPGPQQELQPLRPLAAGADFTATKEVAFRDDADELPRIVHDRQTTDMAAQHDI